MKQRNTTEFARVWIVEFQTGDRSGQWFGTWWKRNP
jgi:hypothetical protein